MDIEAITLEIYLDFTEFIRKKPTNDIDDIRKVRHRDGQKIIYTTYIKY